MARIDAFIGWVLGNIDQTKCWIGEDTSNAVGDGRLAMPRLTQNHRQHQLTKVARPLRKPPFNVSDHGICYPWFLNDQAWLYGSAKARQQHEVTAAIQSVRVERQSHGSVLDCCPN
jgi:hypothetical protein